MTVTQYTTQVGDGRQVTAWSDGQVTVDERAPDGRIVTREIRERHRTGEVDRVRVRSQFFAVLVDMGRE
jgi:hypothetical protein